MKMIKLSDYVIQFIANLGVEHIFLLPGGGCMHLLDSVGRCQQLKYICNLHEQACAIAAEAYGQYTNNLGVALVTTGPGGTNTLTGVAGAWLDSTPCLFISGQVKTADLVGTRGVRQMGFQEINIVEMVKPITKYAVVVTDPKTIRYHLEKAVYLAKNGRPGPVWIDIPLDIQAAQIEETELVGFDKQEVEKPIDHSLLQQQISETIRLLNQAERPCILVGNGVRLAGAIEDFLQLIEILQIPVLTTWKAIDFLPESHWLFAGRPGAIGQRGANFTQQNSDLLITIGARLDFGQTGYNHQNFARGAKKIIVDIDPNEISKMMMPIDVPICADAGDFIGDCLEKRDKIISQDRSSWLNRCKDWQAKYPVILPEYWQESDRVNNYVLIDVLSEEMSEDDLLIPGSSGACSEITMQGFRVKPGMRIFNTEGLGAMGFGIASAIGGCLASGGKHTICIDGDGGFIMNVQELETLKRLKLPIKFFILNNDGYISIQNTQKNYFQGRYVASNPNSGLTLPDISKISAAFDIPYTKIADHGGIREKVIEVLNSPSAFICEVLISPNQFTAPRITSTSKPDGTMVSKPLEDMWPFLERKEFLANMIVPHLEL
ncbi:thiamine pyrophosphate-binding protein [Nostoc sp.]|uniref:thiamine pyrophosphate-binding protein n=2 Tax=unclassified Nostoc TaxID=2593658 RepID=UPI003003EDB9